MMVTDRARYGAGDEGTGALLRDAGAAGRAGVDLVQVREPSLDDRRLAALVRRIAAAVADSPARVVVNDRADVALAAGAAGVHLRSTSAPSIRVRRIMPAGFLVGRSVHSVEEALREEREAACDYLVFGTVFPSRSKPAGHPVAGTPRLQEVCAAVHLPVLAIGGVTPDRAEAAAAAGAAGFAAIELFVRGGEQESRLADTIAGMRSAFASR